MCCSPWRLEESATTELLNELEQLAPVHLNVLDAEVAARVLVLFVPCKSLSIHHQLLELAQTHVHRVSDAI